MKFELKTEYQPTGDQPNAIEALVSGVNNGQKEQVLLQSRILALPPPGQHSGMVA